MTNRGENGRNPLIHAAIILLFYHFFIPEMAYGSGYSITGTGYKLTGDGFATDITTFNGGATHDDVSAAATTGSIQSSDCTGSGFRRVKAFPPRVGGGKLLKTLTALLLLTMMMFDCSRANAGNIIISSTGTPSTSSTGDGLKTPNVSSFGGTGGNTVTIHSRDSTGVSRDVTGLLGSTSNRWKGKFFFDNTVANNGSLTVDVTFDFIDYPTGSTAPGAYSNYRIIFRLHGATSGPWTVFSAASSANTSQVLFTGVVAGAGTSLDFTLATTDSLLSPLPVTWLNFEAVYLAQAVDLNWTTASEINNSYFDIERSTNGNEWTSIGKVQGHGTSNVINSYTEIDNLSGVVPSGIFYYRLKQVDFNNLYQYSWIQSVNILTQPTAFQFYPNPAGNTLNIKWISSNTDNTTLRLVNVSGVNVLNENISGEGVMQKQIDLTGYQAGVYYLQIISGKDKIVSQMVLKSQ